MYWNKERNMHPLQAEFFLKECKKEGKNRKIMKYIERKLKYIDMWRKLVREKRLECPSKQMPKQ